MNNRGSLKISKGLMALSVVVVMMSVSFSANAKPFGNPDDISFAQKLWDKMTHSRLVGKNAFRPMPYDTAPPHGNIVETLDGFMEMNGRNSVVIVKKNFGERGKTTVEDVADNPGKFMTSVTVMYKREKGYDPESKDWFWAKYTPKGKLMKNPKGMALAGRVAKGSDKACIACHSLAPGGDFVYIHDRYVDQ